LTKGTENVATLKEHQKLVYYPLLTSKVLAILSAIKSCGSLDSYMQAIKIAY